MSIRAKAMSFANIPANIGRGRVAGAVITHTTSVAGTDTAITDASDISVTIVANRRYAIYFDLITQCTAADNALQINIRDGGTSAPTSASPVITGGTRQTEIASLFTDNFAGYIPIAPNSLTPGVHRLGFFGIRSAGAGTITVGQTTANLQSPVDIYDTGN